MPELDAEFWVAVAFVAFLGELDEALRLKEEAQALLAQYQRKQREAEQEAAAIIAGAVAEAERMMAEAKTKMEEFIARRGKMAESKIAQAEAQALADVRAAAADASVAAAESILKQSTVGATAESLIAKGISDVRAKLN